MKIDIISIINDKNIKNKFVIIMEINDKINEKINNKLEKKIC